MEFEKLGREMLRRCGGLPLAILVLGGILATKPTLTQWEMVHKEIGTGEGLGQAHQTEVEDILISSYYDLPDQLKPCFMYLSKFPEDSEIEAERLYLLWIAEGMVLSKDRRDGETMMDVAESYMRVLSERCLVQAQVEEEESSVRKFKSCRLHDLMRDLSLKKAEEEDFFRVIGNNYNQDQSRRLVICPGGKDDKGVHIIHDKELVGGHLQSLLVTVFLGGEWHPRRRVVGEFHPDKLKYLRILALEGIELEFKGKHKMIRNIIHLRYLSLRGSYASVLYLLIGVILEHLQTVDLRRVRFIKGCIRLTELSSMLRNMGRRLQHLYLPEMARKDTNEKLRLDGVSNLETLENFDPDWCETNDLFKLTHLHKLTTFVGYANDANVEDLEEILNYLQSSQASNNLRYSSLEIWDVFRDSSVANSEKGETLMRRLWAPNCKVQRLQIRGSYKLQLPSDDDVNAVTFSSSLTTLCFRHTKLEEDPMPILERLPNLRRLDLCDDAYIGKEMVCSAMGCPQLRYLRISGMMHLEEWRVYDGAMCNLSELVIGGCEGLKMVPDGFRFLSALRELHIVWGMSKSFIDGIRSGSVPGEQVGHDLYKIRHVPSVIFSIRYE